MLVTEGFFGEEGAAWQDPDRLSRTRGDQTSPRGGVLGSLSAARSHPVLWLGPAGVSEWPRVGWSWDRGLPERSDQKLQLLAHVRVCGPEAQWAAGSSVTLPAARQHP